MFEDLINSDKEYDEQSIKSLIDSLKDIIYKKEQIITDLMNDLYDKDITIKKLEHELDYLRNL